MRYPFLIILLVMLRVLALAQPAKYILWSVGKQDNSAAEFALAPAGFRDFLARDFGYEDKFFAIGFSKEKTDFAYVLPGPVDTWGGTWPTAGWRNNEVNILFGVDNLVSSSEYTLELNLLDYAKTFPPVIKVSINEQDERIDLAGKHGKQSVRRPSLSEPFVDTAALTGRVAARMSTTIEIPIKSSVIRKGGNVVKIQGVEGSWIMFDAIRLVSSRPHNLIRPGNLFVRNVKPANYELASGSNRIQPLIVDVEHLSGNPVIEVALDGKKIFKEAVELGHYQFEVPMPAVTADKNSTYIIYENGREIERGVVQRARKMLQTLADYVDTRLGTAHSRWMIAPGPWMPFSMVKMSPDNQNSGWQAGYQPSFESVGTFSHIHEWTMAGLGVFATNGPLKTRIGDELQAGSGYRSAIDKKTEEAPIGCYKVHLKDYDIKAEVTATTRCGFERFSFPDDRDSSRVLLDFHIPAEYDYKVKNIQVTKVSDYRIEGAIHQLSAKVWSDDADQDYTLYFAVEFDHPMQSLGSWIDDRLQYGNELQATDPKQVGMFAGFDTKQHPVIQVRSAISLVSIENASLNLQTELAGPFGWNFDAVKQHQLDTWNELFNRAKITTTNRLEKVRFYNSMYRSICSRNTWSDVNGEWRGTDGKVQKLKRADDVALGCDAFWNTFWNLNQAWNLFTPEWSNRWVNSQLSMFDAYGWLAKGPAAMNYVPVMVGEHEIAQMVSAYQMGIRDYDVSKVMDAVVKMQVTPPQKVFTGYTGNRDLVQYIRHRYVPADSGRFSNTMEYSFDDWNVGQLAKALNKTDLYKQFNDRGSWWQNTIDTSGYCHLRLSNGSWASNFDPFRSGARELWSFNL